MATSPANTPFQSRMLDVVNKIHAAPSTRDIIVGLKDDIQALFAAERLTIYALDTKNQQLYSVTNTGTQLKEIRVPKTFTSLAGFCGLSRRTVNVTDAYDDGELKRLHPKLAFDPSWDKKTNFRTRQVLSVPINFEKYLLGVIQLINRPQVGAFSQEEVAGLEEIAKTIGIAFFNQNKTSSSTKPSKYGLLIAKGSVSEQEIQQAAGEARMKNCSIEAILLDKGKVQKGDILQSLSKFYAVPSWQFTGEEELPVDLKGKLNHEFLRKNNWAPVGRDGKAVLIAITDPHDLTKVDAIQATNISPKIEMLVALAEDIIGFIDKNFGEVVDIDDDDEDEFDLDADDLTPVEDQDDDDPDKGEDDNEVVKLANKVVRDAYKMGASDIHIEPNGDKDPVMIRFRTDGACTVYKEVPAEFRQALVSRFKIMSRLDIAEKRKPQDGKIRFNTKKGGLELRVATIPTTGGNEDIVMRILASSKPIPLDKMGFNDRNYKEWVDDCITKPYGLCLVVGPTGSGKTTTLHSSLGYINKVDRKIWTAEDPVEITQKGLRQVQMHAKIGLTFAAAMRAFLRADPDIIMVGEMCDRETTQTGIEASLTGHLVFSTLHPHSAAEPITRLLDMESDPFSFADALLGILAQRLVRTVCKDCVELYQPDQAEFNDLVETYGPEDFARLNYQYGPETQFGRPGSCDSCAGGGFRGRMGIHELLVTSERMTEMIANKEPVADLHNQAVKEGMTTLLQDGIFKAVHAKTTLDQIRAVCMK
ncbi:MAG: GspE/PulE family protein [Acidobacteriota bacterium]